MGGVILCKSLLVLLAAFIALGSCTTRILVQGSCRSDMGSGYGMSGRLLLQAADDGIYNLSGLAVPAEIAVPSGSRLLGALRAVGHQHYSFNGTAWVLYNATAWLYEQNNGSTPLMGREAVVGVHFFLAQPDAQGGQPSWRLGSSQVTAKGVAATSVDSDSITWNLLQTTSSQLVVSVSATSADWTWLGDVSSVQRLDTQRGLPPSASSSPSPSVGDTFSSVYAALYAFYAADST